MDSRGPDGYAVASAAFASMKAYDALDNVAKGGSMVGLSVTAGFTQQKSGISSSAEVPVLTKATGGRSVSIEATPGDLTAHAEGVRSLQLEVTLTGHPFKFVPMMQIVSFHLLRVIK